MAFLSCRDEKVWVKVNFIRELTTKLLIPRNSYGRKIYSDKLCSENRIWQSCERTLSRVQSKIKFPSFYFRVQTLRTNISNFQPIGAKLLHKETLLGENIRKLLNLFRPLRRKLYTEKYLQNFRDVQSFKSFGCHYWNFRAEKIFANCTNCTNCANFSVDRGTNFNLGENFQTLDCSWRKVQTFKLFQLVYAEKTSNFSSWIKYTNFQTSDLITKKLGSEETFVDWSGKRSEDNLSQLESLWVFVSACTRKLFRSQIGINKTLNFYVRVVIL